MASDYTRRDFIKNFGLTTAWLALFPGFKHFNRPAMAAELDSMINDMVFERAITGWDWPEQLEPDFEKVVGGLLFRARRNKEVSMAGPGVHTRNGDNIRLFFNLHEPLIRKPSGYLEFGFAGGFEHATVKLDFAKNEFTFSTSDWTIPQPVARGGFELAKYELHVLRIVKTEGAGTLVKNADITVYLDGKKLVSLKNQNLLPEMGVKVSVINKDLLIRRFVHWGKLSTIPRYLELGGWQMLNKDNIEENLNSICRGLREAAEKKLQLLVTPETSLTGLFPRKAVTQNPAPIAEAEKKLRSFIRNLKDAPYLVAGLPVWEKSRAGDMVRYNTSRVYNPDGDIVGTYPKVHSCEPDFWHGYRLQEFDIYGVPVTMHICHDGRYPDLWTLPVMFGARLILHPANGGKVSGTIEGFEAKAKRATATSHAFYINVNGGGGSYIVGPQKYNNLLAISPECSKEVSTYPKVGEPVEALIHAKIRVHDAFGYWPVRSFRVSEEVAKSYLALYKAMGGKRCLDS
ncbi:MAG: carbon-nitrogen hydrolase family protein [Planctomycetota bacterium]|jgi:predicted amidohydrolase